MPDITGAYQAHNKVCQDLDDLVLEYISLVNEHLTAWTRISGRFQEGRELISQAKYIMGPKNVSADCYDHRMKALRGVMIKDPTTEIEIRDLRAEEIERQWLQKAQEEEHAASAAEKDQGDHQRQKSGAGYDGLDQESSRAGLRRRGGGGGRGEGMSVSEDPNGKDDEVDRRHQSTGDASSFSSVTGIGSTVTGTTTNGTASDATIKKKERNPDPLLWFGVFVPASLRSAQSVFQQGLQDVVEMAMIRQRLIELEGKMATLREVKAAGTKQLEADLTTMKL